MKIFSIFNNMNIFVICMYIMVPTHFHDVDGELSDGNVEKMFGFSKILTAILKHRAFVVNLVATTRSLLLYFMLDSLYIYRLLGVVAKVFNMSKFTRAFTGSTEIYLVSGYTLRLK